MPHIYALCIFWLAVVVGWILNICQIVATFSMPLTGLLLVKIVGIFLAPLGSVLGYITLFL